MTKKTIDKFTFSKYFPLPGLFGERLFAVFDEDNQEEISYEAFISGIAFLGRGDLDQRTRFVFDIYDLSG